MPSTNKVFVMDNLTHDTELRTFPSDHVLCEHGLRLSKNLLAPEVVKESVRAHGGVDSSTKNRTKTTLFELLRRSYAILTTGDYVIQRCVTSTMAMPVLR